MKKRVVLWLVALALLVPGGVWAQGNASVSGTWKLDKVDPPLPTGRGGRGGGGGGGNTYEENVFSPAPTSLVITQTPTEVTVQTGSTKAVYKLDNSLTVMPVGDAPAADPQSLPADLRNHGGLTPDTPPGREALPEDLLSVFISAAATVEDWRMAGWRCGRRRWPRVTPGGGR